MIQYSTNRSPRKHLALPFIDVCTLLLRGFLLFALVCVAASRDAYAQEGAVSVTDKEFLNAIMSLYEGRRVPDKFLPAVEDLIQAKLDWERKKLLESERVIVRTNTTAMIGTVIVHIAVVVGFVAAFLEFFHAWKLRREGAQLAQHELRIGLEGVAVKTSLYGLLILLVASGFYLMYAKFIYPIQTVGP